MNVSDLKIKYEWYGRDSSGECTTMDVPQSRTSTSVLTAVENMTTTTKWETFPERLLTPGYENAFEPKDILFSRGFTGWE